MSLPDVHGALPWGLQHLHDSMAADALLQKSTDVS